MIANELASGDLLGALGEEELKDNSLTEVKMKGIEIEQGAEE
jgi:hypothetical protein